MYKINDLSNTISVPKVGGRSAKGMATLNTAYRVNPPGVGVRRGDGARSTTG
jgi:hypothetical protein